MSLTRMRRKFEVHLKTVMWLILAVFMVGIFFFYGAYTRAPGRATPVRSPLPDVVAMVNGEALTRDLFMRKMEQVPGSAGLTIQRFGMTYWWAFEEAVGELLSRQAAAKFGVNVTKRAVDQQMKALVDQAMQQARQRAKERGKPFNEDVRERVEEFYRERESEIRYGLLMQGLRAKLAGGVKVSDKDLVESYDRAKVRHILVSFQPPKGGKRRTDAEALAKAKKLLQQLRAGADFATLAKKESDDTMSAGKGGDLGWFPKGQMVKEFDTAAFSQQVGVVGEPVKTQFGYHLVLVEERKRDLPKDFEKRKEDYRRSVAEQRVGEAWANFVRQTRAAAKVEIKDPIVLAVRSMMEDPTGEKAIAYFKQAIAKGSGLPDQTRAALHYLLGNLLTGRKKYEEAAKQYEKALDLAPTPKEEVMLNLAGTYQRLKQPDKAIQFVRAATDEAPDNMVASRRAENIYTALGRKDLAEAEKKRREAIEQQAAKEAKAEAAAEAKPGAKPEAKAETQPAPNSPQPAPPAAKPPAR